MLTARQSSEEAIRYARAAQNLAIAKADFDAVAAFWTEDITIRRALGHPVQGISAAREVLESAAKQSPALLYQRSAETVHVASNWALAYEEGSWSACLEGKGNEPILSGRYAAHWVQRNGAWLIRSELFVALACSGPGCEFQALP